MPFVLMSNPFHVSPLCISFLCLPYIFLWSSFMGYLRCSLHILFLTPLWFHCNWLLYPISFLCPHFIMIFFVQARPYAFLNIMLLFILPTLPINLSFLYFGKLIDSIVNENLIHLLFQFRCVIHPFEANKTKFSFPYVSSNKKSKSHFSLVLKHPPYVQAIVVFQEP